MIKRSRQHDNQNKCYTQLRLKLLYKKEQIKELKIKTRATIKKKQIKEKEATKRKQIEEQEATRRKRIEEEEITKRLEIEATQCPSSSNINTNEFSCYHDFYTFSVKDNIRELDVNHLLMDDQHFDDNVKLHIKNYIDAGLKLLKKSEKQYQQLFNKFIIDLLSIFNHSTQLKYMNLSKCYLRRKCPDCTFIPKNIIVDIPEEGKTCLQDFVLCLGELKTSSISLDNEEAIGQIIYYLKILLEIQHRNGVYGFLANITHIRFFYVQKNPDTDAFNYFQSRILPICDAPCEKIIKRNMKTTTVNKQLEQINLNKDTWIIFTKFLIMNLDYYQYTMLVINDIGNLLNNKYNIIRKLGNGLTSNVYLLEKNQNNNCQDYGQQCVIKICKQTKYSSLYLNEIKIMKKLNISNKFNLFFENIIDSSPTGNFLLYQNELEPIKVLKLNQSKQLIDIIQHLYDCNIIHRNLKPENLMLDNCRQQLKLIDFHYAKIYEINEITKPLPIEGSITFTGHKFLHFISHFSSFNSLSSSIYSYERSFDLKCALNIILYMNDNRMQDDMKPIINIEYFQEKALKLMKLWENAGRNKPYSNILYLIDNFDPLSTFNIIKFQLETFIYS